MNNKIKQFRIKKGLSILELSQLAKLSQYQHLVYESGVHLIPIPYAELYCIALKVDFDKLFPGFKKIVKNISRDEILDFLAKAQYNENDSSLLASIGLQADPRNWTLKMQLSSGVTLWRSVPAEAASVLQNAIRNTFERLVIDTMHSRVVLDKNNLEVIQLFYDPSALFAVPIRSDEEIEDGPNPDNREVVAYTRRDPLPLRFTMDVVPYDDPEESNELQDLLLDVEIEEGTDCRSSEYAFMDEDGDDVWINRDALAVLEIPLGMVEPAIYNLLRELHDESPDWF
jgi:transcriptional regulator with XRE-family HTH domain